MCMRVWVRMLVSVCVLVLARVCVRLRVWLRVCGCVYVGARV